VSGIVRKDSNEGLQQTQEESSGKEKFYRYPADCCLANAC